MTLAANKTAGVYLVSMSHEAGERDLLRRWYESERMPALLKCPGVTGVTTWETTERYIPAEQGGLMAIPGFPAYTAIYELDDVNVARSEQFLDASGRTFDEVPPVDLASGTTITRVTCAEIMRSENPGLDAARPPQGMLVVSITPERDHEPMLHEWYDTIHLPELLGCPGFQSARRFRALDGIPNFFALYYLDDPAVLKTEMFLGLSGRPFNALPPLQQRLGPHMRTNICDVYRVL